MHTIVRPAVDLYRFYDAAGRLLYIGISLHAAQRASEHRKEKRWWPEVARMDVEHLDVDTRREAEEIERRAIIAERPVYNVKHSPDLLQAQCAQRSLPVDPDDWMDWCSRCAREGAVDRFFVECERRGIDPRAPEADELFPSFDPSRTPIAWRFTGVNFIECAYRCHKCGSTWACGWAIDAW